MPDLRINLSDDLFTRFARYADITDDCWLWTGTRTRAGYGHFDFHGETQIAHRVSHELFKGPIPDGFVIDHLCRTHHCVNPHHIEAVTDKQNLWRGNLRQIFGWGQCSHGAQRKRDCRICRKAWRSDSTKPASLA